MGDLPCILFEDDDLLAANKPAGIGTHRADVWAPPGLVEIFQDRRPGVSLGIHQRLDRATSGVIVFAKSARANASLARQFEGREVSKVYLLATAGGAGGESFEAKEPVDGKSSRTHFHFERRLSNGLALWRAEPETGRTHQVRLHAAAHGLRIEGEGALAGTAAAFRVSRSGFREARIAHGPGEPGTRNPESETSSPLLLHAARLEIRHPATGEPQIFEAPLPSYFETGVVAERRWQAARALRGALIDSSETDAFRLVHREGDGFPPVTMDCLGEWLYAEDFSGKGMTDAELLAAFPFGQGARGMVCCRAEVGAPRATKRQVGGEPPPAELVVRENGLKFLLRPIDPGGVGLFFDQRGNRRRLGARASGGRMLNLFAYTCAFSVAAVHGGAVETVSVDVSRRSLEWGRENFRLNGLDDTAHHFLAWDAREAVRRLGKRGDRFRTIVLDPPSFGRSKSGGAFGVKRDFLALVGETLALLEPGGWLLASVNFGGWGPREFEEAIRAGAKQAGREVEDFEWAPQGFDFPSSSACPAHLKAAWVRAM